MIDCMTLHPLTVLFSHYDDDTHEQTHFSITHMDAWILGPHNAEVERVSAPIDPDAAQMIAECRGIEQHRLDPLLSCPLPFAPVYFVTMPCGTHLLVDGSHRYVASHMRKQESIRAYVLTWAQAQQFIVTGIPDMTKEQVVGGYSGL
jgi:hypothetical protein